MKPTERDTRCAYHRTLEIPPLPTDRPLDRLDVEIRKAVRRLNQVGRPYDWELEDEL